MNGKKPIELRSLGQPRDCHQPVAGSAVRTFLIWIAAIFVVCAVVVSGAWAQSGSSLVPAGPKKAEEQFKNIQTLKGIPADQLIPAMQFITASLGVECEFCHVQGAFEKDDKEPKNKARKMMEMMFAINKDNFDGHREVTCYSCHHGSIKPIATPALMSEEPKAGADASRRTEENAEEKAPSGPSADELFEKYLKAVGGAAAVDKVASRTMKGTITFGDRNIPIEIYSKDPDKRVSITHTPDGESITAFDGHEGWLGIPRHAVREMHGPDIDGASIDADLHFPAHLKDMFNKVEVQGS